MEFVSATAVVLAIDQVTKALILGRAGDRGVVSARRLRPVVSRRWLLTMAPSAGVFAVVWVLAAAAILALTEIRGLGLSAAAGTGLTVALGGAAGNLVDRMRHGGVIDFIRLGWWPAFNVADIAIVAGAAVAVASEVAR